MNQSTASELGRLAQRQVQPSEWVTARIVIADDDVDTLDLLSEILYSPTTEIHRATSGAELVVLLARRLLPRDRSSAWCEQACGVFLTRASESGNRAYRYSCGQLNGLLAI